MTKPEEQKIEEVIDRLDHTLCKTEVFAPGWSGLVCEHPIEMHDPVTGKCNGHLEFGWGDYPCKCDGFSSRRVSQYIWEVTKTVKLTK